MAGPPARGGSRSLVQFLAETTPETWYEEMKQRGLTDHEIKLLEEKKMGRDQEESRQNFGVQPDVHEHRMSAIKQKLAEYEARHPTGQSGQSRASDITKAVNSVVLDSLSTIASLQKEKKEKAENKEKGVGQGRCGGVTLLPVEVIARHRLSLSEITTLPHFRDYERGVPSKVLYVKNVHRLVTEDDLIAIFGNFAGKDNEKVTVRLMSRGRMRGQAFVEMPTVDAATQALELANGYLIHDQPLIVSFSHRSNTRSSS